MPKQTTLFMSVSVLPIQTHNPETGEEEDGKQLVFSDPMTGEELYYPMGSELAVTIAKKLRMSNKALVAFIQDEQERAEARAKLAGGNGIAPTQAEIDKLLRESRKEGGK